LLIDSGLESFKLKPKFAFDVNESDLSEKSCGRVAIFAAFVNTEIEKFEVERVIKLLTSELDSLILVNTGSLEFEFAQPNFRYFHRMNFGRDLASYKYALNTINLESTSELFFFNDSVLWTDNSILNFLTKARESILSVTSLTSSDQHTFHLQSYALHLKGNIAELTKAFSVIRISNLKRVIVEAGEKALSQYWMTKQIGIGSVYTQDSLSPLLAKYKSLYLEDYDQILSLLSQNVPLNPSIHLWAPLYAQSGVVKNVLLTKNPAQLKYAPKTIEELQSKVALDKN
jgi:hypothetical protein